MNYLENGLEQLLAAITASVPSVILAVILLILAFLAASILRAVFVRLCIRLKLDKRFSKRDEAAADGKEANDLIHTFGKIVFVIVFVLFLPGILDTLQLSGISQPIQSMVHAVVGYLPNIIGAAAIFIIGMYLARIIKQIAASLLRGINVKKLQEKVGALPEGSALQLPALIGNVVYALILVPVAVAALQVLNIDTITTPAINMLDSIFGMVPNVVIAVVLIFVGVFVGKLAGSLLSALLAGLGVNGIASNYIKGTDKNGKQILISDIIGGLVKVIIILLLVVQSFNVLHLEVLNSLGTTIVAYLPDFVGAIIIFGAGLFFASFVEKAMQRYAAKAVVSAGLVRAAIVVMTVFMTLNQLKVASLIVNTTFIVIIGAIAVAFAIAFGIGGRDMAAVVLKSVRDAFTKKEDSVQREDNTEV